MITFSKPKTLAPLKYQSELMRVENLTTGKLTYWVKKCDVFQRVGKSDYDKRYHEADGFSCLHTKSTKKHRRHYITAVYTG